MQNAPQERHESRGLTATSDRVKAPRKAQLPAIREELGSDPSAETSLVFRFGWESLSRIRLMQLVALSLGFP